MLSPGVQAAVAASPTITTAIAAAGSSSTVAGGEAVTSSTEGGMEFTLDASTLEQLRGAGDASALMDSSVAAAAGFGETTSEDQTSMQVDGCDDRDRDDGDWIQGLVQLDGPMDSEDVAGDDGDEEASGEVEGVDQQDELEAEGGDGADGGFDAGGLDSAANGGGDVPDAGFVNAADELSAAAAASSDFTSADLSSHAAELDADDPAAAYMMQVRTGCYHMSIIVLCCARLCIHFVNCIRLLYLC